MLHVSFYFFQAFQMKIYNILQSKSGCFLLMVMKFLFSILMQDWSSFFMNAAYPSFIMSERFSPCKKLQNVNTYSLQFKKYLEILTNQRPYNSFKRAPLYFFSNNDISLLLSFCFDAFDWKNPGFFYTNCFSI